MKKELVPPFPIPFFDQLARLASAINIPANERVAADLSAEWAGGGDRRWGEMVLIYCAHTQYHHWQKDG